MRVRGLSPEEGWVHCAGGVGVYEYEYTSFVREAAAEERVLLHSHEYKCYYKRKRFKYTYTCKRRIQIIFAREATAEEGVLLRAAAAARGLTRADTRPRLPGLCSLVGPPAHLQPGENLELRPARSM